MKRLFSSVLLFLGVSIRAETLLHVAPRGNDSWSGQIAEASADGKDGPLATVRGALEAARRARKEGAEPGARILLRSGTYELDEPLVLTPEDSGTGPERPFTLAAYHDEKPVLSGGHRLEGWKEEEPGVWTAELPEARDGKLLFRQLFVNGQRRQRARTPNTGFFRIEGPSSQDKPATIHFHGDDIKKHWAAQGDVEVIALMAWSDIRMPIRSVDEGTRVATLAGNFRPSNREENARYYVENAADGCDVPGEWFLDARTGKITYRALPGEDLAKAEVIVPRLQELLRIQGDLAGDRPVRHVLLQGLTFCYTDRALPEDGYADTQAAVAIRGDLAVEGAHDLVVENCKFTNLAGYAIDCGAGCQNVRIVRNEISEMGAGGVRLGTTKTSNAAAEATKGNEIVDNEIRGLGRIFAPAVGVLILQSGQNRVAHNHIHDLSYTAVSVGWTWGYRESPCRENIVEFNHLHHVGNGMLSDLGGIYTLGPQPGTVLRNNLIHDVESFSYGGWGIYTDEGSSEILIENNVVYRCKSAGFHQHYGKENTLRNNIFALGREHQLMRSREESHLSFHFINNIVCFESGDLLGSTWNNDQFRFEKNLYWDARLKDNPGSVRFAGATMDAWRARGHDLESVVADPLFVNPANGDFGLQAGSPALPLGFNPIDLRSVGPRKPTR